MPTPLRVLVVEDNVSDARLLVEELRSAGLAVEWTRAETEQEYLAGLDAMPELILADYVLPGFDALRALQLLQQRGLDIPVIVVSGQVGEETVVRAVRAGACDYLLKDRLVRLGDAVSQALAQCRLRRERARESGDFLAFQQRTRLILDSANDPYIEMDTRGYIIEWNARAEAVFGWTRKEAVGRRLADTLILPEQREEHERGLQNYLKTGHGSRLNRRIETTGLCRDGRTLPVEVVIWPIRLQETVTFSAFVRDMSVPKQAEAALVERVRFGALSADVGLALTQSRSLGDMLDQCARSIVNNLDAAFARIWTLSPDQQTLELQASAGIYTHVDGSHSRVPVGQFKIGQIAQQRLPHLTNDVMNDPRVSDQPWARREGMVAFAGYPLLVEDRLVGVMAMFARQPLGRATLDAIAAVANQVALGIERKRADASLHETNERLQSFIQASPLAIVAIDRGCQVLMWNPAAERIFGWTAAEVLGRPVPFVPPDERGESSSLMADEFKGRSHAAKELRRLRKDGSLVDVSLWSAPLRDALGQVVAAMGIYADTTDHKRLEEQFRQAQKMEAVGRLAGGVAHDFNNLLTVILGYADELRGGLVKEDPLWEPVRAIDEAARRAASLTRQLLAFSRKQVLRPTLLDLNSVVKGLQAMLKRLLGEDISLAVNLCPDLVRVRADHAQIEQVIMNLSVNARDAMPDGGALTVETYNVRIDEAYAAVHSEARAGEFAMLSVSDTGNGMDQATLAHIFEPFFTTKDPGKGTGLGLATIYGIVKQSDGFVGVYSEVGLGTTFKIYLPRVTEMSAAPSPDDAPATMMPGTETLLLVEDEESVRRLASLMLRRQGYAVLEACNGEEALQCAERAGMIDLLVTDVVMPRMNGRQLADRLRLVRPQVKVLFTSGYTDDAVIRNGVLSQGQPFLQKPFTAQALTDAVRRVLDSRSLLVIPTWPANAPLPTES